MSLDRFLTAELGTGGAARCRKRPRDIYTVDYMGTQRSPRQRPDEAGAIAVVDLLFGGRIVIYAIPGDNEWRRVERRP